MLALPRPRPAVRRAILALLISAGLTAAWFLYYGGRYLQHEDPLQKSDAIFVLAGTRAERPLEAIDLYKEGYAPIVILSPGIVEDAEVLLAKRGVRFPRQDELQRDALVQSGLPAAAVLSTGGYVDNTAQEANLLRAIGQTRGFRRVIIVTSKYHTRRSAFAFRRGLDGTGVQVVMRASRYDSSDPARWWRHRSDLRYVLSEWQKLLAYYLGLQG